MIHTRARSRPGAQVRGGEGRSPDPLPPSETLNDDFGPIPSGLTVF